MHLGEVEGAQRTTSASASVPDTVIGQYKNTAQLKEEHKSKLLSPLTKAKGFYFGLQDWSTGLSLA